VTKKSLAQSKDDFPPTIIFQRSGAGRGKKSRAGRAVAEPWGGRTGDAGWPSKKMQYSMQKVGLWQAASGRYQGISGGGRVFGGAGAGGLELAPSNAALFGDFKIGTFVV